MLSLFWDDCIDGAKRVLTPQGGVRASLGFSGWIGCQKLCAAQRAFCEPLCLIEMVWGCGMVGRTGDAPDVKASPKR